MPSERQHVVFLECASTSDCSVGAGGGGGGIGHRWRRVGPLREGERTTGRSRWTRLRSGPRTRTPGTVWTPRLVRWTSTFFRANGAGARPESSAASSRRLDHVEANARHPEGDRRRATIDRLAYARSTTSDGFYFVAGAARESERVAWTRAWAWAAVDGQRVTTVSGASLSLR